MSSITLTEHQWTKIVAFLRSCVGVYVGNESDCRRFVEAILYQARSGAQWRLLPERYGQWNSVYKRFAGWCDRGIWTAMLTFFTQDADLECLLLDSTVMRAHPCAAGASAAQGGQAAHALGRSRGGFSTKTHVVVDGLGNPLDLVLTAGQSHDVTQGPRLLRGRRCDYVIGD